MTLPSDERKQIENEMLFRRANEHIGRNLDRIDKLHIEDGNPHLVRDDEVLLNFKCECSDEKCTVRIPLRLSEYKTHHSDRDSFIVKPHHEVNPIEKVIATFDTYSIVKKNNSTTELKSGSRMNKTDLNNADI